MGWDEGSQGMGGKQLKNPEESTQGNRWYKKPRNERERETSEKRLGWTNRKCMEEGKARKKAKEKQMADNGRVNVLKSIQGDLIKAM